MGVLHEETLERIRASAEDDSLRIEMNRRFDDVLRRLDDHAAAGDAADRHFARTVAEQGRRLDAVERRGDSER
jgi:hypothetical protein